jgi:hypothetical protein
VVGAHISIGDLSDAMFALLMYPELGILFYKNTIWNIYARDTLATRTLHRLASFTSWMKTCEHHLHGG